jgi:hypothetical protein
MYHCIPMEKIQIQIQTLTHGYQDCLVSDVFQNVMSKLVQDMEYFMTYLDDWLFLTNSSFKDHLLKLETVLARLSTAGMRVNISKSKFFVEQIEYLGYWITRQGIQPMRNKVEINAILNIKAPKTRKEKQTTPVYWYSQLYRDMWFRRSELLAWFHRLSSHQARSSLNGTHPINKPLKKSRKSLERRYFSAIQTSISPFIFTLMHQIISWGQSSFRIKSP